MFSFVAEGPLAAGFNTAILGYSLAPDASLTVIVEEMRSALSFLSQNAREYDFRSDRIIVGGWSAGGHLTAAIMDHPAVAAALPISGIFDLEPISLGELNDLLQLTAKEIETLSPINTVSSRSIPVCVAYGELELPELRRQSTDFIERCQQRGLHVRALPLDGHHHFSILNEFSAPDGQLLGALRELAR
jgi:arylformamidase